MVMGRGSYRRDVAYRVINKKQIVAIERFPQKGGRRSQEINNPGVGHGVV